MQHSENHRIVFVTAPSEMKAKEIATAIVSEKLAACCTLLNGATSIYRWNKVLEEAQEVQMIIKTNTSNLEDLEKRILELHNYDTPEIFTLKIAEVSEKYSKWLHENCG